MRKKHLYNLIAFMLAVFFTFTPLFQSGFFSYADSVPDGFTQVNSLNEQVQAFQYYCKSRNLAIEGSILDAVTQVTTKAYQTAVNAVSSEIGFDINSLQAELYSRNTSNGQQFFYTASGINAMNRIFAEFLQNNNLAVGDDVNKNLYSGEYFTTADGYNCLVYYATSLSKNNSVTMVGTPLYGYSYSKLRELADSNNDLYSQYLHIYSTNDLSNYYLISQYDGGSGYRWRLSTSDSWVQTSVQKNRYATGALCVYRLVASNGQPTGNYGIGNYIESNSTFGFYNRINSLRTIDDTSNITAQNVNVYITTNNNTINNNTYEGDTIINNEGDIINPNPNPTPTPIPDPNDNHSTTTNPITPSNPDNDANLTFPLIDLDLPSIDWSIGDLSHKFPFSIPFDLVHLIQVFDAEPEAPRFQGTVDFGFTTYDYDINFEEFNTVAAVFRTCSLIGFIFGLLYATRYMIKG